jgi:hypothetical protein
MSRDVNYKLSLDAKGFTAAAKEAGSQFEDMTKKVASGTGPLGDIAAAAGPAGLAIAAIGGAAVAAAGFFLSAAKGATDLGGKLSDMSARTGLSAESLQKLGAAAKLSGGSMESISGAVSVLQKNLAKSPEAFTALGLSVQKLRSAKPEDLLLAVSNRLQEIPEGTSRAQAGFSLLGKGAAEYLPILSSDLQGAAANAQALGQVLSNDTVSALDDLGDSATVANDTWDGFKNQLGAIIATSPGVIEGVKGITAALSGMTAWVKEHKDDIQTIVTLLSGGGTSRAEQDEQLRAWNRQALAGGMGGTSAAQRRAEDAVMNGMGVGMHGPKAFDPEAAEALKKWNEEVKKLAESLGRAGAQEEMRKLSAAFTMAGGAAGMTQPKLEELRKKVLDLMAAGAQATPVLERAGLSVLNLSGAAKNRADLGQFAPGLAPSKATEVMARDSGVVIESNLVDPMHKAKEITFEWGLAVQDLSAAFSSFAGSGTGALASIAGALASGIAAWQGYADAKKRAAAARSAGDDEGADAIEKQQKVMGGINAAGAAVSIFKNNQYNRSAAGGAMSGAASGAAAGAAFGPYGMVIGAVVGGIIGALSGSKFRQVCKDAGKELGGAVSDELGKAIMKTAKDNHLSNANASLLHISDFVGEDKTGTHGITTMGAQIKDLFSGIVSGSIPAKAGMEELNKDFDALATAAAGGDIAAQKLTGDLIQQGIATGKLTDSMKQFIADAMTGMASGADLILKGLGDINKKVPLGDFGVAAAQLFMAGFEAEIAQKGLVQAIEDNGAGITDLYQRMMDEGNTAAAAVLAPFVDLSNVINNDADPSVKGFLEMLQGMSQVFTGLDKLGFVTGDSFQALETGAEGAFNALTEGGASGKEALMAISPQLAQIIAAHEKYGIAIDEGTQKLIDEAKQAGVSFPTDPVQAMIGAVHDLIDAIREMNGLPPRNWGAPPPDPNASGSGGTSGGESGSTRGTEGLATGGVVRATAGGAWTLMGDGGEDEFAVPRSKARNFAASVLGGGDDAGGSGSGGNDELLDEMRALRNDMRSMLKALPKQFAAGLVIARG